ncbi:hypothetical protein BGZ82_001511, partial [Podila clonocystis]
MAVIQEDDDSARHIDAARNLLLDKSDQSLASGLDDTVENTMPSSSANVTTSTTALEVPIILSEHGLQRQPQESSPGRPVDRNWARVRQKMIGSSPGNPNVTGDDLSRFAVDPKYNLFSDIKQPVNNVQRTSTGTNPIASIKAPTSGESTPKSGSGGSVQLDPSLPLSTSIRGVLGFRTVVLQRTQLRKMEKEIEKAIARQTNETSQPRSRTTARIGTGTRGMIPGATYTIMNVEPGSLDRAFLDDLSDILTRWKSLTVEVPCRTEIFRVFSKMLLSNRSEPLS